MAHDLRETFAQTCSAVPDALTNGITADATQVMANFNYLIGCIGGLRGYLGGLTMSNDGTSPNTVIDTSSGVADSDDVTTLMTLATAFTKNANAAWASGTGNGCLDTGSGLAASQWYHLFVVANLTTNAVDEVCSQSATSPTLPSGYTKKRRIGSFKTNASAQILAFYQMGDIFMWGAPVLDVNVSAPGSSAVTRALSVPVGIVVEAIVNVGLGSNGGDSLELSPLATSDPGSGSGGATIGLSLTGTTSNQARVLTNTSAQIRTKMNSGGSGSNEYINTLGWRDFLGRYN